MNVFPIQAPPEGAESKCPNCGVAVVADQRYCLTCGQPCSPTRLAFLDVLQAESELRGPVPVISPPVGYAPPAGYLPPAQEDGAIGWLRRYSGLFGLLAVLLMTGLIGLLVGHWISPSKASGPQVVKIEGTALPATGGAPATTTAPAASTQAAAKAPAGSSAATEAQEKKEVKEAESPKAKAPPPVKTSPSSLKKLEKLTGKKHQQAIESLTAGGKPIETGG